MEFIFRDIGSTSDINTLIDFMSQQPLGYPNYDAWLQRSEPEFHMGYKQAILAFSDLKLIGDLVFQPDKYLPKTLEIKNLRIHPNLRRRDFGHFMLRQLEEIAKKEKRYNVIRVDTRSSQKDIIRLLKFTNYRELARAPLYDSNEEDVILTKSLLVNQTPKNPIYL
jgi:ribosomal protein S18 acetylase RimI-like enzyme